MAAPADKTDPFDPFGVAAAMTGWCCLLKAAQEIRDIDQEMMETMMEADAAAPAGLSPEAGAKLQGVVSLMRRLQLDPEAVRRSEPETMRALEAACRACGARSRCERELRAGTAGRTYPDFCPNAARLDRLRHA
ncbi:DUF6455 family protein [Methylobacterium fujisawaense]|uniref:DUF6455 family protein n=1 Tax=Methylobacterium fujisawaense TaxID=107400 RepID=UPI0036F9BF1E